MPNTKSAIRKVKKVKKQALLNKFWKRKYKLAVKNMEKILEKKNKKEAISSFPKFQSELMRVAKKGVVKPIISKHYSLDEASLALDDLKNGKILGRAVINP